MIRNVLISVKSQPVSFVSALCIHKLLQTVRLVRVTIGIKLTVKRKNIRKCQIGFRDKFMCQNQMTAVSNVVALQ